MTPGRPSLGDRLRYRFDSVMSRGTPALIGALAVASLVLILVFSGIVLLFGIAPDDPITNDKPNTILQLFRSFQHALDAGTISGDTGGWEFLVVMLVLTLAGLFVVSALIGVIATGLDSRLTELRKGRSFVLERDHTLILGWSETVFSIVAELAIANESRRNPAVVILAERDKVEMEDAIREHVGELHGTRVVCRSGSPVDLRHLAIGNPQQARSIIVLAPDRDDPDAQVIKTILALTRGPARRPDPYHIVAEIHDRRNLEAARLVGGDEAVLIDKNETIARLLVQASRQSGIAEVYGELLDFAGDEIYMREDPAVVGKTYGEVLFAYEDCALIGLIGPDGAVRLNPASDTPIAAGDRVIAVAEDDARLAAAVPSSGTIDEAAIVAVPVPPDAPARILILGWNARSPIVLRELDDFHELGSSVLVVSDVAGSPEEIAAASADLTNITVTHRAASTTDRATLDALAPHEQDHVIVLCYADALDREQADARTLVTLLHLRDIADRNAEFSIISEMLEERNRELAQVTKVDDVIVSDRILSLLLTQISENGSLAGVFGELLAAEGVEAYLRPADAYVKPGGAVSYATIVEAARRRGETAIGYRHRKDWGDPDAGFGLNVNPPKSWSVDVSAEDRVVVLAET